MAKSLRIYTVWPIQEKWNKWVTWTSSKLKTLVLWKTIKRMEGQTTDLEKIFANYISDRRLLCRMYEELSKLNRKTIQLKNQQKTWDISLKRIYRWQMSTWKDVQHHYPLGICKLNHNEIGTTHLSEWLKWKTSYNTKCWQRGETGSCRHCLWEWKRIWQFLMKLNRRVP